MSDWTGAIYGIYSNKPIKEVFAALRYSFLSTKGYEFEYHSYEAEESLLFYKNKEMLNCHAEYGYNERINGEGCFCIEAKTANLFGTASLFEFDGNSDFEPYDINFIFEKIYYYVLIVPHHIEESKFSKEIHKIFIDVVKSIADNSQNSQR